MGLIRGIVKISWYDAGEGYHGDFNGNDQSDEHLLRFDIHRFQIAGDRSHGAAFATYGGEALPENDNTWVECEGGSHCTLVPNSTSKYNQNELLGLLMDKLHDPVVDGTYRTVAEEMSWISAEWLDR